MNDEAGDHPGGRIFAVPAGESFARAFVDGFMRRYGSRTPEAIARITVYLNSAFTLSEVRRAFASEGRAMLLPRLKLVASIGLDDDTSNWEYALLRQLRVASALHALTGRIAGIESDVALHRLSTKLSKLMRDLANEDLAPEVLDRIQTDPAHAAHWIRNLELFRAASIGIGDTSMDPERQRWSHVRALDERWLHTPPSDPVIVAGSTGTIGSTALLMRIVARQECGAVVLPAFDPLLADSVWRSLADDGATSEVHPMHNIARFLASIGLDHTAVSEWAPGNDETTAERRRMVSIALQPASVTHSWVSESKAGRLNMQAFDGLSLIEAPDRRTEALAIALCLRAALEDGKFAAVVTPDRQLARQVAACLDRWGIVPDDRAGIPLAQTSPGRFLRLIAQMKPPRIPGAILLSVLRHPLSGSGNGSRSAHLAAVDALELSIRSHGPAFADAGSIRDWGSTSQEEWLMQWSDWLAGVLAALDGPATLPLSDHLARHLAIAGMLAAGPQPAGDSLWSGRDGEAVRDALLVLQAHSAQAPALSREAYSVLLSDVLSMRNLPPGPVAHRGIVIIGPREARALTADLAIVAGLNEGVWPPRTEGGPFLSRAMLKQIGLPTPETETGLLAQDFQHLVSLPEVVLTRAKRDSTAPTVPSRWLLRMKSVAGGHSRAPSEVWQQVLARGQRWLDLALMLELPPPDPRPARRTAPVPPRHMRPRALSVTQIRSLVVDPYSIYASQILRLRRLPAIRESDDPQIRGIVFHEILQKFVASDWKDEPAEVHVARFLDLAERTLNQQVPWPTDRRLWLARLRRMADAFVRSELKRQEGARTILSERKGRMDLGAGLSISARPDRIDLVDGKALRIVDYKTGSMPKQEDIGNTEFQIILEAAMASSGSFPGVPALPVREGLYVRIGGDGKVIEVNFDEINPAATLAQIRDLMCSYADGDRPFTPRRMPAHSVRVTDYDGISRYGEWLPGDEPFRQTVGQ